MNTLTSALAAAELEYAKQGWPVALCKGKVANLTAHGINDATTDLDTIRQRRKEHPDANIAIRIGPLHMVVDVDAPSSLAQLPEALAKTRRACSSGNKTHHWFSLPPGVEVPNSTGKIASGIDVKTGNAYVVVPPSVHPDTGLPYTWLDEDATIALAPDWLIELAGAQKSESTRVVSEGERNSYIFEQLCKIRRDEPAITETALESRGHELNENCKPPLQAKEVCAIVNTVFAKKVTYLRDTMGNVKCFVAYWKGLLRYVVDKGTWIYWTGHYWEEIGAVHLLHLCQSTVERMAREANVSGDEKDKKWAYSCRQSGRIEELKRHVAAQVEFWIKSSQLDANPWLLCCGNGTVDLCTGELRKHRKEDYITKCTFVDYVPTAACRRWSEFLMEALPDKATMEWVQRAVGYSLTGSTKEEKLFFIIGVAGTGKSTFIEAVREVFGSYAVSSRPRDFLTSGKRSGATPEVARLAGARLAVSSEVPASERLNEEVKALVDGTMLSARDLYKTTFQFKPCCKIWLTANNAPKHPLGDTGIERRVRVIPFERIPAVADSTLKEQFRTQEARESILAWIVLGAWMWTDEALEVDEPDVVKVRTKAYLEEQNPFVDWYEECCEKVDGAFTSTKDIENSIASWAFSKRRRVYVTSKIIAKAMKQFGHVKANVMRKRKQANGYRDLCLGKTLRQLVVDKAEVFD